MADPKPQPGDGPENHADLAAWHERHPHGGLTPQQQSMLAHLAAEISATTAQPYAEVLAAMTTMIKEFDK